MDDNTLSETARQTLEHLRDTPPHEPDFASIQTYTVRVRKEIVELRKQLRAHVRVIKASTDTATVEQLLERAETKRLFVRTTIKLRVLEHLCQYWSDVYGTIAESKAFGEDPDPGVGHPLLDDKMLAIVNDPDIRYYQIRQSRADLYVTVFEELIAQFGAAILFAHWDANFGDWPRDIEYTAMKAPQVAPGRSTVGAKHALPTDHVSTLRLVRGLYERVFSSNGVIAMDTTTLTNEFMCVMGVYTGTNESLIEAEATTPISLASFCEVLFAESEAECAQSNHRVVCEVRDSRAVYGGLYPTPPCGERTFTITGHYNPYTTNEPDQWRNAVLRVMDRVRAHYKQAVARVTFTSARFHSLSDRFPAPVLVSTSTTESASASAAVAMVPAAATALETSAASKTD